MKVNDFLENVNEILYSKCNDQHKRTFKCSVINDDISSDIIIIYNCKIINLNIINIYEYIQLGITPEIFAYDIIKELKDNDIKSKSKLTEVLQKYNNEYNKKLKEKKK